MPKGIYKNHNWAIPDIEDFKNYYLNHPIEESAKHFNASSSTIIRFARKYNIHRDRRGKPQKRKKLWTDLQEMQVIELYRSGFIATQIAEKVKLKRHQVIDIINKNADGGYCVRKISDLKGSARIEYLTLRRENHYEKTGDPKFSLSDSQKSKISETRLAPGFREKYHDKYSAAQRKLVLSGRRPFGTYHALKQSKTNTRWKQFFESKGLKVSQEFCCGGKFYDLKINNILIEINPTYTHNSTIGAFNFSGSRRPPLSPLYHLSKTLIAEENGFKCVHVWDWDNPEKILDLVNDKKEIIYARKCEIKEPSDEILKDFLKKYHLQNSCKNQDIKLGLYYKDDLVQIMTFGKPRYFFKAEYELLRLCTKSETIVVGGTEKLFNYFLRKFNPTSIISYCDRSKFLGNIYKNLGFRETSVLKPDIKWVKGNKIINDSLLLKLGADHLLGTSYGKGISNSKIFEKEGFVKVCGVGQQAYMWCSKSLI